ncbi:MAG: 1,4-dihydroxy-2-naphthoate octaprenyltransferase [Planctomycetota bacterium]|nr:MAG: 1,4-dihydroxy-2-naphthoate octaprenyltransferase [Planctomycetota bacterium]
MIWLQATRPKTLLASVAPVIVGSALGASAAGQWLWLPSLACLVGALLIQIGTNFANDAFDGLHGADGPQRHGPQRAVASGQITARSMLWATGAVLLLALIPGIYLAAIAGWPLLVLGIISLICAIAYTGGPFPLAYHGLGDLFVWVFFGFFAVLGSAWVQAPELASWPLAWWWYASAIGLQASVIIAVNNHRDRQGDHAVGKRTLAVRLGTRKHLAYIAALHLGAWICLGLGSGWSWPLLVFYGLGGAGHWLFVASREGRALNPGLGLAAILELVTAICIASWYA